jgi:hypothetical protein
VDQSPLIVLPASDALVRFQLSVAASGAEVYRADLLTASGETLLSADLLKPSAAKPHSIDFDVPASTLKSGQYQIKLSRTDAQAKQESSRYYFRVQ